MGTFCLSPIEWLATGPKVDTAACLPSRSVEENPVSNSVDHETLGYTGFAGRSPTAPSFFQNTATLGALTAVTFTSVSVTGTMRVKYWR
jgi:hypothetical protein